MRGTFREKKKEVQNFPKRTLFQLLMHGGGSITFSARVAASGTGNISLEDGDKWFNITLMCLLHLEKQNQWLLLAFPFGGITMAHLYVLRNEVSFNHIFLLFLFMSDAFLTLFLSYPFRDQHYESVPPVIRCLTSAVVNSTFLINTDRNFSDNATVFLLLL